VRAWPARHSDQTGVFYLLSYAPKLNPDEYLNGDLKAGFIVACRIGSRKVSTAPCCQHCGVFSAKTVMS
jgi:hypothetical protein